MDYLEKELYAQLRAAERLEEVKTIAAALDTDSTFLAPSLEKYGTLSVVDLLTAVCLVEGINPEHLEIGSRGENLQDERDFSANGVDFSLL